MSHVSWLPLLLGVSSKQRAGLKCFQLRQMSETSSMEDKNKCPNFDFPGSSAIPFFQPGTWDSREKTRKNNRKLEFKPLATSVWCKCEYGNLGCFLVSVAIAACPQPLSPWICFWNLRVETNRKRRKSAEDTLCICRFSAGETCQGRQFTGPNR